MDLEVRGRRNGVVLTVPFHSGQRVPVKLHFKSGLVLFKRTAGLDFLREYGRLGGLLTGENLKGRYVQLELCSNAIGFIERKTFTKCLITRAVIKNRIWIMAFSENPDFKCVSGFKTNIRQKESGLKSDIGIYIL